MQLLDNFSGNYRFLTGIAPYSAGVVAMPGYEIIHVTLQTPLPYVQGFDVIEQYLAAQGRPLQTLCAVELRLPKAPSFQGFIDFNGGYRNLLTARNLLLGEHNPIARTNVAPAVQSPTEPVLYAFSYTVPSSSAAIDPTFVVAGAGDLRDQAQLTPDAVVRPGETSMHALLEKATTVMTVMHERLTGLQRNWTQATAVDIYTAQPIQPLLSQVIFPVIGRAAIHGVHWFYSHPPIADLLFEMDLRGVRQELRI